MKINETDIGDGDDSEDGVEFDEASAGFSIGACGRAESLGVGFFGVVPWCRRSFPLRRQISS